MIFEFFYFSHSFFKKYKTIHLELTWRSPKNRETRHWLFSLGIKTYRAEVGQDHHCTLPAIEMMCLVRVSWGYKARISLGPATPCLSIPQYHVVPKTKGEAQWKGCACSFPYRFAFINGRGDLMRSLGSCKWGGKGRSRKDLVAHLFPLCPQGRDHGLE